MRLSRRIALVAPVGAGRVATTILPMATSSAAAACAPASRAAGDTLNSSLWTPYQYFAFK